MAQVFVSSNPSILAHHVAFHLQVMPRAVRKGRGRKGPFLNWHHNYLTAFEDYLERTGLGHLTPVPEWKPGHDIPRPFWVCLRGPR